jgi:hypothetical protein
MGREDNNPLKSFAARARPFPNSLRVDVGVLWW